MPETKEGRDGACPFLFGKGRSEDEASDRQQETQGEFHTSAPSLSSKVNLASGPHISGPQCVICKVTVSGWRMTKRY